ncbi:hypothetical protein EC973_005723 [Apophysomyces ossiformis]|uniref:Methylated-DNA--protein-cysteine methyltransferase n=1 Tax=Apophysomyces ossiformis TaxID=679940 RepID=A0A8H7ESR5_9FUNG|nr:hypothetical protein EC973_005723 [Apophysomyces ossiformis]
MAQLRVRSRTVVKSPYFPKKAKGKKGKQTFTAIDDNVEVIIPFPLTAAEREKYTNPKTGKRVTDFQYRVYDLCAQIPKGQVSTYKLMSDALKSHPRAVGQALRVNPFCPLPVPCHRVIAADLSIGGFSGSIGDSQFVADKKAKLAKEGCQFDDYYKFVSDLNGSKALFNDFKL